MSAAASQAYAAGMTAFQAGDLEAARAQFTAATQADARAFEAAYALGVVRERLGDVAGARAAYRSALGTVPDFEPAIAAYALLTARTAGDDEAEAFLREWQGRVARSAAIVAALAEIRSLRGDSAEAQRLAQEALKIDPNYRPAMETLARDHFRSRRLDLALYVLKGILDGYGAENPPRDKDNAQARLLRGLIYAEQGRRREAIAELEQALRLRPDLVEARVHLALHLLQTGNAAGAAPLLEGAIRYQRDNVIAHLYLADAYRLLGKTTEALREFNWVLAADPGWCRSTTISACSTCSRRRCPGCRAYARPSSAIEAFETYAAKRSRAPVGGTDDTDELIARAKAKKAVLESEASAPPAPPVPPPPAPAAVSSSPDAGGSAGAAVAAEAPDASSAGARPPPDSSSGSFPSEGSEPAPDQDRGAGSLPPLEGGSHEGKARWTGDVAGRVPGRDGGARAREEKRRVITISEVTIVGRIQKPSRRWT
jgi:tetratricopeptide (TPR) repeat protein